MIAIQQRYFFILDNIAQHNGTYDYKPPDMTFAGVIVNGYN